MDEENPVIFHRLPSGAWGIKGPGLKIGDVVEVAKRDGTKVEVGVIAIVGGGMGELGQFDLATFKEIKPEEKTVRHPRGRIPSSGFGISLDFAKKTRDVLTRGLDEALDVPSTPTPSEPKPAETPTNPATPTRTINEADIARAAAAVIRPRLNVALEEFGKAINTKVEETTKTLVLSSESKEAIAKIARTQGDYAALQAMDAYAKKNDEIIASLERMIPQRLEIKTPTFNRILPAEPRHRIFPDVLSTLLAGEHVYLVGEAGTGKTHLFTQIGKALDQPTTILGQTLTKYEFSGHMGPTGEYVSTLLRKAVEEGHLLCIDEIDTSASAAIVFLNSLLANRFIAFPDKMVEAHPDFKFIAAANTFGFGATAQYIGRNPLDAASLDRFTYIECHYDEDLERLLYGDTPWTTYVHRVRKAVNQLELKHIISMRAIDRGRKLLSIGRDATSVCRAALWRDLQPDSVSRIEEIAGKFTRKVEEAEAAD